jgi:ATP-dependent DNA helicase RecG
VLKNLGCAEIAGNGNLSYTNAGILFFRNNHQNVHFDFAQVVCALYKGTDKVDIIDAKEFGGGIIENIDNAIVFLKRNLKVGYEIKSLQRKNVLELPEDALREAVTNSVCHRDYFEKGARVMVEIFDDRVEITNPGSVPKGITKDNFGNTSVTRNPVIASLLHRAHYIERMGTGIKRMIKAMETAGFEKPEFKNEGAFFKVIFGRGLFKYEIRDVVKVVSDVNDVAYVVKDDVKDVVNGVKENQLKVVELIKKDGKITIPQMARRLNISTRQVQRLLKPLIDNGIVLRIGGRKQGYWKVKQNGKN